MSDIDGPRKRVIVTEVQIIGVVLGPWHQPMVPKDEELGQTVPENPEEAW